MKLPNTLRAIVSKAPAPAKSTRAETAPLRSDAFLERAMDSCGDAVYRVALAQTGCPADADDVYQDVFLRLLKDATEFANDEHLKAWLLRVTINRCHDLARSAWKRKASALDRDFADSLPEPESFQPEIWEVVGELPANLRAAVHLFYVEGYSTDEIARIMQCQPATVRTRLHRARGLLKERLHAERDGQASPKPPTSLNRNGGSPPQGNRICATDNIKKGATS